MPGIALKAPPPSTRVVTGSCFQGDQPSAQSREGQELVEITQRVLRQWSEPAAILLMSSEEVDELSYEHVPPNRVCYVKTRYVYAGKGLPRPFDLDDE